MDNGIAGGVMAADGQVKAAAREGRSLRAVLLEALSQRLVAAGAQPVRQHLFGQGDPSGVKFRLQPGVVLCVIGEMQGGTGGVLRQLVPAGTLVDSHPPLGELACFASGEQALATAVALVRKSPARRWRVGLHAGESAVASFAFGGETRQVLLGDAVRRVIGLASLTVPGTIQAWAAGYEGLEGLAASQQGCLMATEFVGDSASVVTLAPTPTRREHGMSTFAGLGAC
jgi:hypothetical protein